MTQRLALVVDDSQTARVTLQRMLEQQDIATDTVESAEKALDYLGEQTPDVIFMDHMMPGMDGLQAVEAIKGNPLTATIPIMMYTSREGDLYVSQARALGAIGILPKEVEPAELFQVLNNLGMVKERRTPRSSNKSRLVMMDDAEASPEEIPLSADQEGMQEIARKAAVALNHDDNTSGYVGEMLEDYHHEMVEEIRELRGAVSDLSVSAARPRPGSNSLFPALLTGLVMLVPLLWLLNSHFQKQTALDTARQNLELTELAEQQHQAQARAESSESASLRKILGRQQQKASEQSELLYESITWAINQSSPYDIREEAFSDRRLAILQELITRLGALGFSGLVQLDSHLGEFCLAGNNVEGYILPPPEQPVTRCSLIGHPLQQLPSLGERQSIAFANFIATSPLVNSGNISIEIIPHRYDDPRITYPPRHEDVTAYDWNRIAGINNRVEVTLLPATE